MPSNTTIVVGSLKTSDEVPYRLQGMTICYTTRQDVAANNKFAIIDDDNRLIQTDDGSPARFGFDIYGRMRNLIDFNDDARMVVEQDYHIWLEKNGPRKKPIDGGGSTPGGKTDPPPPPPPPPERDPSSHLFSFFMTCLIITIVVCLGRLYGPTLIEGVGRLLG